MSHPFVPALKLVAEEVVKDVSKLDSVLPSASLRVEASQQCIVYTALRLAKKCKRGTRHLCVRDVERAIELEAGEAPLYFTSETEKALDAQPKSTSQPALQVYYDTDVQLKDFVLQQAPKVPIAPSYTVHWLAVDGVQPNIPENQVKSASGTAALLAATEATNTGAKKRALEQEDVAVMTRELQLYFDKTLQVLLEAEVSNGGGDSQAARRVLNSITNDAGIDRLVPHFVAFICQRVKDLAATTTTTTTALPGLWTAVRLAYALITNETLKNLELYLHNLLPSLLTCVVAQSLCSTTLASSQDHWALRDFAAVCVSLVCKKFAETYVGLYQRVCKVFTNALELKAHALTSRYGGICGLAALGPGAVDSLLVPFLVCNPQFIAQLEAAMEDSSNNEFEETEQEFVTRIEAFRVFHALRQALVQTKQFDANKTQLLSALGYEQHGGELGFMELW